MAIKFEKIQPGMTLWTKERRRMGNTTMRETVAVAHYVEAVEGEVVKANRQGRTAYIHRRRAERMSAKDPRCSECRRVGGHKMDCSKGRA
jgi:hypothetical protein